ncbi:hypothetical protein [Corynebacterium variabile]|uniref:hypothetical protein n=1 Tax=Corynebacterium variabile TaxID=1727 RepID=UPI002898F76A|nr:hypothetical protein [Corynebacterium variabile]
MDNYDDDFDLDQFAADLPKPKPPSKAEWASRRRESEIGMTGGMKDPFTIQIFCSHKGREADGRPVTLAEAIVDRVTGGSIRINPVPVSGNMPNRSNRKDWYNPDAYDRAVPAMTPEELAEQGYDEEPMYEHDRQAEARKHVPGKSKIRRNASTSYESDQMICPRCTLHEIRKQTTMDRLFRALAADGVTQLDVSYIDVLLAMLPPEPVPDPNTTWNWL